MKKLLLSLLLTSTLGFAQDLQIDRCFDAIYMDAQVLLRQKDPYDPLSYLSFVHRSWGGRCILKSGENYIRLPYWEANLALYYIEDNVKIRYADLPGNAIAKADSPLKGDITIIIDADQWMTLNNLERAWTIAHEYYHEAWGIRHGEAGALMFPYNKNFKPAGVLKGDIVFKRTDIQTFEKALMNAKYYIWENFQSYREDYNGDIRTVYKPIRK